MNAFDSDSQSPFKDLTDVFMHNMPQEPEVPEANEVPPVPVPVPVPEQEQELQEDDSDSEESINESYDSESDIDIRLFYDIDLLSSERESSPATISVSSLTDDDDEIDYVSSGTPLRAPGGTPVDGSPADTDEDIIVNIMHDSDPEMAQNSRETSQNTDTTNLSDSQEMIPNPEETPQETDDQEEMEPMVGGPSNKSPDRKKFRHTYARTAGSNGSDDSESSDFGEFERNLIDEDITYPPENIIEETLI